MNHAWPGNVRELRNLLEQAVLLCHGQTLGVDDLGLREEPRSLVAATAANADGVAARTLPAMERDALMQALERSGWNVSRAARDLGISRDTLRYRIDKHGLATAMPADFRETR
jgi:DNA-binding NtrC family response regulator